MSMQIPALRQTLTQTPPAAALEMLRSLRVEIESGWLIPYLGPSVLETGPATTVPLTAEALAMQLHARAPVRAALRGNMWGTAQFIEQRRHRKTLVAFMADIFKAPVEPGPLHRWLATLKAPLIVDTWYDGALAAAFRAAGRTDFGEVQGATRALHHRDIWTMCYDANGQEVPPHTAATWTTVLYKPHGSISPAQNFLVADSDYVEVLTEIDIQTPIPEVVRDRRRKRGFLFLGCRFNDQMLRIYARQIIKRSGGQNYVVVDTPPTRMEARFYAEVGLEPLEVELTHAVEALTASSGVGHEVF
jgi:hypothetical protein